MSPFLRLAGFVVLMLIVTYAVAWRMERSGLFEVEKDPTGGDA